MTKIFPITPNFKSTNRDTKNDARKSAFIKNTLINTGIIGLATGYYEKVDYTRAKEEFIKITNELKNNPESTLLKEQLAKSEALLKKYKFKKPVTVALFSIAAGIGNAALQEWVNRAFVVDNKTPKPEA